MSPPANSNLRTAELLWSIDIDFGNSIVEFALKIVWNMTESS